MSTFLDRIKMFNNIISDIYTNYKNIYKIDNKDKCYINVAPLFVNTKTLEKIYNTLYVSKHDMTLNKIILDKNAFNSDIDIRFKTINIRDQLYLFNIVNKSFVKLQYSDLISLRDIIDYDKSKIFVSKVLNNDIKHGKYLIETYNFALHIENYIINHIIKTDCEYSVDNVINMINQLYDEFVRYITNLEIYLDLLTDIDNNIDTLLGDYDLALRILIISHKTDNNKEKIQSLKKILLSNYKDTILEVLIESLKKSIFMDIEYGVSVTFKFTDYLELLFYISTLEQIKNI